MMGVQKVCMRVEASQPLTRRSEVTTKLVVPLTRNSRMDFGAARFRVMPKALPICVVSSLSLASACSGPTCNARLRDSCSSSI
eukprot:1954100-Heterocapsa_arctica.AAC.1